MSINWRKREEDDDDWSSSPFTTTNYRVSREEEEEKQLLLCSPTIFFFNLFLDSHCFEALSYFEILWFIFSYIPIEKKEPRNNNMGDLNGSITDLRATFLKVFDVLKSELLNDPAFEWTANSYAWVDRVCFPFPFLFLYFFIFYLLSHSFPPYNVLFFFFLLRINFYFYSQIKREYWLKNWYLPHNHSFTFLHLLSAFNSIL